MKSHQQTRIAVITLFAALTMPLGLAAQDAATQAKKAQHHHYKLIDVGTFGGPGSGTNDGGGGFNIVSILNNRGTFAAFAETQLPDPFGPNFCYEPNCYVAHALQWQDGVKTDLGVLAYGVTSAANWISPNGLIAGFSENGETDPLFTGFPQIRAVLWRDGRITDLGALPEGGYQSFAESVNNKGQVVGAATNTILDPYSMGAPDFSGPSFMVAQTRAFLWEDGVMQDLGTLGGPDAMAQFINEKSQVVGWSYTSSTVNTTCPFLLPLATGSYIWDKQHGMRNLGSLGGDCTLATGLNNSGMVVGDYFKADQTQHGFLWKNGSIVDLGGTLGGNNQGAEGLSGPGEAVGWATLPGEVSFHAVVWKELGQLTDLGVVGSDRCSFPTSINSKGQVVGLSQPDCVGEATNIRAFLWENGSMTDLNSLLSPGESLYLLGGSDINDRGEIAGVGLNAVGAGHDFLLIPCDDDHPDVEGCDYSMVDATAAESTNQVLAPTALRPQIVNPRSSIPQMLRRRLGPAVPLLTPRAGSARNSQTTSSADSTLQSNDLVGTRDRAEITAGLGLTSNIFSCPRVRCSSHFQPGRVCGCIPCYRGFCAIHWGYDLTYKRACNYEYGRCQ